MIRVVIADDHAIVRTGLRVLIKAESAMELIGEATGGYEAIEMVEKMMPDVLVLDLSMPDLDGIAVTKKIKPQFPELRILILTLHEDEALLKAALKAGAAGYVLKRAAEAELISAIHGHFNRRITRRLFDRLPKPGSSGIRSRVLDQRHGLHAWR